MAWGLPWGWNSDLERFPVFPALRGLSGGLPWKCSSLHLLRPHQRGHPRGCQVNEKILCPVEALVAITPARYREPTVCQALSH